MPADCPRILTVPFGCALAFAAGIGASRFFPLPASICAALSVAGATAFLLLKGLDGPRSPRHALAMSLGLVLAWGCAGAWCTTARHEQFLDASLFRTFHFLSPTPTQSLLLRGWIADDPVRRGGRLRFLFNVEECQLQGRWRSCRGVVRVSLRDPDESFGARYGDRLELPLRLRIARNFKNPGAFDYRLALEAEGVHLLGTLKSWKLAARCRGSGGLGLMIWTHRLRMRLLHRLGSAFPGERGDEPRRFLCAVLLGARDGGEGPLDALMRKTGVYHILSISGLHFALLMALVSRAARRLSAGDRLETLLLLLIGGLYLLLSGGEDPILRSALAGITQAAGQWSGRRVSAWNAQALAGLALLAISPLHLFQPGFQLSFLATLGILAGGAPWWTRVRRIPLVGTPLAVSLGAWIASTPVMTCTFLQVSPVALIMNLVAGPFLTFALAGGVFLLAFPSEQLGALFTACLVMFGKACAWALQIPGAFRHVPPPPFILVAGLAALLWARLLLGKSADAMERRFLGLAIIASLLLVASPPEPSLPEDTLTLTALDVGQGDSLLLNLPGGHWILVDGGGFSASEFDVGERIVLPALLTMGVRRLDLVVLTHAHQDHGGGLPSLLEALPTAEIWLGRSPSRSPIVRGISEIAARNNTPLRHPTRGSVRCFGETCLEVMHPPAGYRVGQPVANDDSLVLRITYRHSAVLLTGDVETEGESLILRAGVSISAQVLKIAHHGSASSTSEDLLARVLPGLAVVSVGEGNPWGHPSQKVLERLRLKGVKILRTDREGAVQAFSDGTQWGWRPLVP